MHTTGVPVESFGAFPSEIDEALAYPGARPAGSFIVDQTVVVELPDTTEDFRASADSHLAVRGAAGLEGRIPILAYGANANPAKLIAKLEKYRLTDSDLVVPVGHVMVPDVAVAWHGRPGQNGSTFAELFKGPETVGATLTTHVTYLTEKQAAAVHASEGDTYSLVELNARLGDDQETSKILAYVALNSSVLLKDNIPVSVAGLAEGSPFEEMTAEAAVDYMLAQDGVAEAVGAATARELVGQNIGLKLSEKKRRQAIVDDRLRKLGSSRPYVYPAAGREFIGRLTLAAQGTLSKTHSDGTGPQFVTMPEVALTDMRPSLETVREKAAQLRDRHPELTQGEATERARRLLHDPVAVLRRRSTSELEITMRNNGNSAES